MDVELIILQTKIALTMVEYHIAKDQKEIAIEILRRMAAHWNSRVPRSLTDEEHRKLIDDLLHIDKLRPTDPQADDKD